jgi:hypothetical protein
MLHCLAFAFLVVVVVLVALLGIYLLLRTGFSLNGKPMRFDPSSGDGTSKTKSWYIEGVSAAGVPISCSFVEFVNGVIFSILISTRIARPDSNILLKQVSYSWSSIATAGRTILSRITFRRLTVF